jgi:hypothetical protein
MITSKTIQDQIQDQVAVTSKTIHRREFYGYYVWLEITTSSMSPRTLKLFKALRLI